VLLKLSFPADVLPEKWEEEFYRSMESIKGAPFAPGEEVIILIVTPKAYHTDGTLGAVEVVVEVVLSSPSEAVLYYDSARKNGEDIFAESGYWEVRGVPDIVFVELYSDRGITLVDTKAGQSGKQSDDPAVVVAISVVLALTIAMFVCWAGLYVYRRRQPSVGGAQEAKPLRVEIHIDYGEVDKDMQLPEDIITESLSVPQEMAALAETIKNPDTLPEIVFHQLRFLVGLIAPEDRELSRAAMVKTGVVPHIVQMLELPTGPEGSKTLPSEERLKLMPVALQAIFYLLRSANYREYVMQLGVLPRLLTLIASSLELFRDRPELVQAFLVAVEKMSAFRPVQLQLQKLKAQYVLACLMKDVPLEHPLFVFVIRALNAVCSPGMAYLDVASTTKLYGGANSLENLRDAVLDTVDHEVRASAVELLGKLCGTHVGMCQHLKDVGAVDAFVAMIDPSRTKRETRGIVTSFMIMTKRAETIRAALRHAGAIPRLVRVLLESPDLISQERAIWTLNNMCAKSSDIQHMIRHEGGLDAVMRVLETATDRGRIKAALACIFHLAESPANQDAIRTQGGLAVLLKHARGEAQGTNTEVAMVTLRNVLKNNESNRVPGLDHV